MLLSQFWTSPLFQVWFCCFLTHIQISQETGNVVWFSHLLKNFPQFVVIHTVKCFGTEVDVFLELFMIQWMLAIWSLVLLPFLNPAWTFGSLRFMYSWKLAWRILSITLLVSEMSIIVWLFDHSLALPFFGIGMKTDLFQSCGRCWVFQICWHIECSTFTASSFRIWNWYQFSQSCPTPFDHMDCSTPGFPVHHQLLELTQHHVHPVGDAI